MSGIPLAEVEAAKQRVAIKREQRIFGQKKAIIEIKVRRIIDEDADLSYLNEPGEKNAQRMRSFGDTWNMIGIRAEAQIGIRQGIKGKHSFLTQTITSGGLWGIESDSSKEYLESVELEEIDELREVLRILGFTFTQIKNGVANATRQAG